MQFRNRHEAGIHLAEKLVGIKPNTLVVGIARGGVLVSRSIAQRLHLLSAIVVVKKISTLANPELAIGAVGPAHTVFWDTAMLKRLSVTKQQQKFLLKRTVNLQKQRQKLLAGIDEQVPLQGKDIILVDDGIATGATVRAAAQFLRKQKVASILLAVPVIARNTRNAVEDVFDYILALHVPTTFHSVSAFYASFPQVEDTEILSNTP